MYNNVVTFKITPQLDKRSSNEPAIYDTGNVSASVTSGFPNDSYQWYYAINSGAFSPIPNASGPELNMPLSDLPVDPELLINQMLYIRAKVCDSQVDFIYSVKLTPPVVTATAPVAPVCSDGSGQLALTFNRSLKEKEYLSFRYTRVNPLGGQQEAVIYPYNSSSSPTLDANNRVLLEEKGFASGTYTYTITDVYDGGEQNRTNVGTFEIPVTSPVTARVVTFPEDYTDYHDLQLNVSGGVGAYRYTLVHTDSANNAETSSGPVPDNGWITGLQPGYYQLSVTDANGCAAVFADTESATSIGFNVIYPLQASLSPTLILCTGGKGRLIANASGGFGAYSYSWKKSGTDLTEVSDILDNVGYGNYQLTVTDGKGKQASAAFELIDPAPVSVSSSQLTHVLCYGDSTGVIAIVPSGGTNSYTFSWTGPGTYSATTQNVSDLKAGNYQLKLADTNGCPAGPYNFTITQPLAPLGLVNAYTVSTDGPGRGGGEIVLTISGGTPDALTGYEISWDPAIPAGQISSVWNNGYFFQYLTNLTAGLYTIMVTDKNLCVLRQTFTVADPPPLSAFVTQANVSCKGYSDGYIRIQAGGGKPQTGNTYKITWYSNGSVLREDKFLSSVSEINQLSPGSYSVEIEDSKGEKIQRGPWQITEPDTLAVTSTATDVKCFGANTGRIVLDISGGTRPWKAVWSSGQTGTDLSLLPAGNYSITVTDAHGCTATTTNTIAQPASAIAIRQAVIEHPLRIGADGSISEITISGGVPGYSYSWIGPSGSELATGNDSASSLDSIPAGTYRFVATDSNGCTASATYVLKDPLPLLVSLSETKVISCKDAGDAKMHAIATGGAFTATNRYIYEWYRLNSLNDSTLLLRSASDSIKNDVSPATYFVWVEDKGGTRTRSADVLVSEPEALTCTSTVTDVFCHNGNDGTLPLEILGGTAPYRLEWTMGGSAQSQVQQTSGAGKISSLVAGSYHVVIADGHGCVTSFDQLVGQPSEELLITTTKVRGPTGIGLSTGIIKGLISGGTPGYSGQLTNSSGAVVSQFTGSTIDISGLAAGTYTLTVHDFNFGLATQRAGCRAEFGYTLKDPEPMMATLAQTRQVLCYGDAGGALKVVVSGGIELDDGGYYYEWYRIENGTEIPLAVGNRDHTAEGLIAGRYVVKATDLFDNSIRSNAIDITQPLLLVSSGATAAVSCYGGANGALSVTVAGGTFPYAGELHQDASSQYFSLNVPGSKDFPDLPAGVYTVTITDANLCRVGFSETVSQPAAPVRISLDGAQPTGFGLNNGTLSATISGGTPPYAYTWQDDSGQIIASGTGSQTSLSNLGKGLYSIVVTDANYPGRPSDNGCQSSSLYQLNEPAPLVANLSLTASVLCKGEASGALKVTASGGVPATGYRYEWYQFLSAGDSVLLAGRAGASEAGFKAGTYFVWVIDKNNNRACTPNVTVDEPSELLTNIRWGNISCFGGANGFIEVSASGGTPPYAYRWTTGDTSASLENLPVGAYQVTVTDSNGCKKMLEQTLISPETPVSLSGTVTQPTAYLASDGKISVTVSGGVAPYRYTWSRPDGMPVETDASGNAMNLADGYYRLTVTDNNYSESIREADLRGCMQEYSFHLIQPPLLEVKLEEADPVVCTGESNGSLRATVTGGVPFADGTYRYQWVKTDGEPVVLQGVTGNFSDQLKGGTYRVTVTDANNISQSASFTLANPDLLTVSFIKSTTPGNSLEAVVSGGRSPYAYIWNTGSAGPKIDNLPDGQYNVWVTDALGCSVVQGTTIGSSVYDPSLPLISLAVTQPTCFGGCDGMAIATVSGGKAPYRYDWGQGDSSEPSTGKLCAGTYFLKVTDAAQKTATRAFIVKSPDSFVVPLEAKTSICRGETYRADATVAVSGASYLWTSDTGYSSSDAKIEISEPGKYTVTVKTPKGCVAAATLNVEEGLDPGIDLDYALTSQAAAGRKLVVVNTSLYYSGAEYTGEIDWILPSGAVLISKTNESAQFKIDTPGNYEIGIETRVAGCKLQKIKSLTVTPDNGEVAGENGSSLQNIIVYPNPNSGNFRVKVELAEPQLVKIFLLNPGNYGIVWSKVLSGSALYETNVAIGQPVAGVYFVLVVTGDGQSTVRKVIIQ